MSKQTKCKQCTKEFSIEADDLEFYKKIEVPEPKNCPECRLKRRLMERNARVLYYRKCELTGKQIISQYHGDHKFPVYDQNEWLTDKWDPMSYGQDLDINKSFFSQFKALNDKVPHFSTFITPNTLENSDYTNCTGYLKNCYLIVESDHDEDCYYSNLLKNSKDIVDCSIVYDSELCYECIDCINCYNLEFSQDCENCRDSSFLKNCQGCSDCIGCVNQNQKKNMIFNEQYSPEDYAKRKAELFSKKRSDINKLKGEAEEFSKKQIYKYRNATKVENCSGDHIYNSKNSHICFDSRTLEDCKYCAKVSNIAKDCMDYNSWGDNAELVYQSSSCGDNINNLKFCTTCVTNIKNLEYCDQCTSCSDCFGCVGLKKKQYCILNKQYSEAKYNDLREKLIAKMKADGEWGEFFPIDICPFGYNETIAMDYFPLTKEEATAQGYGWRDPDQKEYQPATKELPDSIEEVDELIMNEMFACIECKRNYKIIAQELSFYKKQTLALPEFCPTCRHLHRIAKRNRATLYSRECMCEETGHDHSGKCLVKFETTYSPDRIEKIYCEDCYNKVTR